MQRNKQAKQQPNNKYISVFKKKFKYIETKIDDTEAIITC